MISFFFWGACDWVGFGFGCFCSFVSFPPTPENKKKTTFGICFFAADFSLKPKTFQKMAAKKNTASFQVFMNMLLINLLIAIILDTYKEVQKAEESGEAVALAKNKTLDPKCPNKNRRGTVLISRKMWNFKGKLGKLELRSLHDRGGCTWGLYLKPHENSFPLKLTCSWKIHHLKMYFLLKMAIFLCHVSFPECRILNMEHIQATFFF